jgi:hypothetical protein
MKSKFFIPVLFLAIFFVFTCNLSLDAKHRTRIGINIGTGFTAVQPGYVVERYRPIPQERIYVYPSCPNCHDTVVIYPQPYYKEVIVHPPVYQGGVLLVGEIKF